MTSKTFLHPFSGPVSTGPDALTSLQNYLTQKLHGRKLGQWNNIKITSYYPSDKNLLQSDAYIVSFQQSITDIRHCHIFQDEILETDEHMKDILLIKLMRFVPRTYAYIDGDTYECGDFLVRLGYLYIGQQKKAIIIEV